MISIPKTVLRVMSLAREFGEPWIVGGAVADSLRGAEPNDWDVVVEGATTDQLAQAVGVATDKHIHVVGSRRPAARFSLEGVDIDLYGTPSVQETVEGFDFTMNGLATRDGEDIRDFSATGTALADLEEGVLRAMQPLSFCDDAVRCLRAMQLFARKCTQIHRSTVDLLREAAERLREQVGGRPHQRVEQEWRKLLLCDRPQEGLRLGLYAGILPVLFPELCALHSCLENPEWHPSGNAWEHTMLVVELAALAKHHLPAEEQLPFMWAALLHDTGKPLVGPVGPELRYPKHEQKGEEPARAVLERVTQQKKVIDLVISLVVNHLQPYNISRAEREEGRNLYPAWVRLNKRAPIRILRWLSRCDGCAERDPLPYLISLVRDHLPSNRIETVICELGPKLSDQERILEGRDLVKYIEPGPALGVAVTAAFEAQVNGLDDRDALIRVAMEAARTFELENPEAVRKGRKKKRPKK